MRYIQDTQQHKMVHANFILTPISSILSEAQASLKLQPMVMENIAIGEYVMQTIFLKMTGFQEQKCKCINWELATDDYEYRYDAYGDRGEYKIGEGSSWDDKCRIFKGLQHQILKEGKDIEKELAKEKIKDTLTNTKKAIKDLYLNCPLMKEYTREYVIFEKLCGQISRECLRPDLCDIFSNKEIEVVPNHKITLTDMYKHYVYRHRNRCAHNLLSYQENRPTMNTMSSSEMAMNNYFIRFLVVALIDDEMRLLFELYNQNRQQLYFM